MRYMLDTSICVELIRGRASGLLKRMRTMEPGEVGISSITLAELQYGLARCTRPAHQGFLLAQFCAPLEIAAFDDLAAQAYGKARAALEAAGKPIGPLDTLIAAHAAALGATLVTDNEREFRRLPGLKVENWLRA